MPQADEVPAGRDRTITVFTVFTATKIIDNPYKLLKSLKTFTIRFNL
jgi:hypothetical protein